MTDRAIRRAEKFKRKQRVSKWDRPVHPLYADTPKPCSCDMCGNPRRSRFNKGRNKLTQQEQRHLEEYGNDEEESAPWLQEEDMGPASG